jgi:hypothetical protein
MMLHDRCDLIVATAAIEAVGAALVTEVMP